MKGIVHDALAAAEELEGLVQRMDQDTETVEHLLERFVTVVERYVFCSSCRERMPGAAHFCMSCGSAIRAGARRPRYEYTDLTLPLGVGSATHVPSAALTTEIERTIQAHLDLLAEDGWQPIGRVDLASLERAGHVVVRERAGFISPPWTYESVRLRLRRRTPAAPAATAPSTAHRHEVARLVPAHA